MNRIKSDNTKVPSIKSISIDGPFGTSAENIFNYEKVVLIGKIFFYLGFDLNN